MFKKIHYRAVFISDVHLGNPKNQGERLIDFLNSISFDNLIIVGDFIDYWQLNRFGKRGQKEEKTLKYINELVKNGVKITYIQGNHDRELRCTEKIKIENMTICREMYYKTLKGKTYYVTHGDCMDGVNRDGNNLGQIGSVFSGILQKIERIWNKNVYNISYDSFSEKMEELVKNIRMPENKINRLIMKFSKKLDCDGIIVGHFHLDRHYDINGLDYFCTGDWLKHPAAVVEDEIGNLKLIQNIS